MEIELGFQPNCSETVFRFSKQEVENLSPEAQKIFWVAAANGCTSETLAENMFSCLGLPSSDPHGGEYSSLVRETEDQFLLSYYQTSNEMLLEFAKEHLKEWLIEGPFTREEDIPKDHNYNDDERARDQEGLYPMKEFVGNLSPIKGFEYIIELRRLASESAKEKRGLKETLDRFAKLGSSGEEAKDGQE
jgi:hypothetical protein